MGCDEWRYEMMFAAIKGIEYDVAGKEPVCTGNVEPCELIQNKTKSICKASR